MSKIILSRKGYDKQYGGNPSVILPDGTMLSFPIPIDDIDETGLMSDNIRLIPDNNKNSIALNNNY